ncbi:MAG: glycosyltransferase [Bacteroidota bacterium]|jgi:glycosyltransferase involved in cell wall biosynthesis
MKTLLLARPDHSTHLYDGLRNNPTLNISYHTFSAFKKGSCLNRLKPSVKSVKTEVDISLSFTLFHRFLFYLNKQITFNYYERENQIAEYFYRKTLQKYTQNVDIIHYWPVYCHHSVQDFQRKNSRTKLLADVYAAHPDHVRGILEPEFDKFNLSIRNSHFVKSRNRDIASLDGVKNILVPSEYLAKIYQKYFPNTQIFTASYGLFSHSKNHFIEPKPRSKTEVMRIVFVGKISIEKGCHYLLETVKELSQTEFQLDLIGDFEPFQANIFKKYTNSPNIRFLGKLPHPQILKLLPQYHIFALPSLSDAYSLAVSEALMQRLPVIITENVGNKDDVKKFQVGTVCAVKNVDALKEAIITFRDEEYRQSLRNNIAIFLKYNQENSYSSKVLEIYNQLLIS